MSPYHALIRTHHMTSRRKIAALTAAAVGDGVGVVIRTGGVPGIMYVCGLQEGVGRWVRTVKVS
jgi:hypothetical protein